MQLIYIYKNTGEMKSIITIINHVIIISINYHSDLISHFPQSLLANVT